MDTDSTDTSTARTDTDQTDNTAGQNTNGTTGGDQGTDTAQEIAKWKDLARKHEDRAKANATAAKELEQLRQQSMSEQEKAVTTARQKGITEAETKWRSRFLGAEVRALSAGKVVDPDLLASLVDPAALKWDGDELDRPSIEAEIARVLKAKPYLVAGKSPGIKPGGADGGPRGTGSTGITRESLKAMTPQQVASLMQSNSADVMRAMSGT